MEIFSCDGGNADKVRNQYELISLRIEPTKPRNITNYACLKIVSHTQMVSFFHFHKETWWQTCGKTMKNNQIPGPHGSDGCTAMAQAGGLCFGPLPVLPDGHGGILDCGDMWMEEILYQRGWAWVGVDG